jgi:dipeptidyl aminopeptidase/acylaminoacyl peptidase
MYVIVLLGLLAGACTRTLEPPASAKAGTDDVIDLLSKTNAKIEQFQFSPDGRQIAYVSSQNGSADIWVMNADGSNAHAITDASPEAEAEPQWSPDGQSIAYVTHHCGTGCWADIFLARADGSITPIDLTYGRGGPQPQWTPDGKSIVFVKYYGDNGFSQIGVVQADIPFGRPAITFPTGSPENEDDPQVSPDGKSLLFTAARSEKPGGPRVSGIWVVPLSGGAARLVVAGADGGRWSPDGRRIAFVSANTEWRNVGVADAATGVTKMLTSDTHDNGNAQWSPAGTAIAYVANEDWNFHLKTVSADGGQSRQLTDRAGVNAGFEGQNARGTFRWAPDGQSIAYTFMDYATPSDLWLMPSNGGSPRQITNHMPAALKTDRFVAPELVSYKSQGDVDIPAFLYKPKNPDPSGKAPLLLYSHSFGGGMYINGFYPFVQYFVSRGFVVLAPEVRGSTGRGRTFARANRGDWGGLDIDDTVAGIDYLDHLGLIDRNRVVMQGGSTGGYRTMQTAVRFPDALKAAVNLYGPTNVVSLHQFYQGTRRRGMMMESVGGDRGDPAKAPEHWRERSSTYNVDRIKTPILLLFADRDLGVPASQAEEYYRLAKAKGVPVDYVAYSNESHGWYTWRPATMKDALQRVSAHYDKYLNQK